MNVRVALEHSSFLPADRMSASAVEHSHKGLGGDKEKRLSGKKHGHNQQSIERLSTKDLRTDTKHEEGSNSLNKRQESKRIQAEKILRIVQAIPGAGLPKEVIPKPA